MECNFSGGKNTNGEVVKLMNHVVPQSDQFRYLGSIISRDGKIGEDVSHKIKSGWTK